MRYKIPDNVRADAMKTGIGRYGIMGMLEDAMNMGYSPMELIDNMVSITKKNDMLLETEEYRALWKGAIEDLEEAGKNELSTAALCMLGRMKEGHAKGSTDVLDEGDTMRYMRDARESLSL